MKTNYLKSFFLLSILLTLVSCSKEQSPVISSTSENGNMSITVQGERYFSTDPYKVSVAATTDSKVFAVEVEVMADELSNENVSFEWQDNETCFVYITQRDGSVRTVPISVVK